MKFSLQLLILFSLIVLVACHDGGKQEGPGNELIIFHAGSLSVPVSQLADTFMQIHPDVRIVTEAAGSVQCARKITELKKPCDIILTSDYKVIRKLLVPEHTGWYIKFASNELCIAFTGRSRFRERLTEDNWTRLLLNDSVEFGRSDPNLDPCGYRTLFSFQLAEKYYGDEGLAEKLRGKDHRFIRPKEVDLLALLESGAIDYIFIYRSVALQHGLDFLILPDEINLKEPRLADWYSQASVEIAGKSKNERMTVRGEPMEYGVSILDTAPNPEAALKFVRFMLDDEAGLRIIEACGQSSLLPSATEYPEKVPAELQEYIINLD